MVSAYDFILELAWASVFCMVSWSNGVIASSLLGDTGKRVRSGHPKRAVAGGTRVVECGVA